MNINIIITEEQKRILIKESIKSKMGDVVKSNYEFTKKIIGETIQTTGINLEFMLTWGASIGGFMVPINEYLKSGSVEISDMDLSLVLTSIMATLYLENKTTIKELRKQIRDRGLSDVFISGLKKTEELKYTFLKFIESMNITFSKVSNMLAYSFIVPILPMLYDIESTETQAIVERLLSFGLITISSIVLRDLISKIIKRFNPNQ
tara:strand:+ start:2000 stop:2617 length:618 start_codon:yes stop_codon:yes gene_type:complete